MVHPAGVDDIATHGETHDLLGPTAQGDELVDVHPGLDSRLIHHRQEILRADVALEAQVIEGGPGGGLAASSLARLRFTILSRTFWSMALADS